MKKNIAILTGGDSSEREISIKSAKQVQQVIDPVKYNVVLVHVKNAEWMVDAGMGKIPIDKNDFSFSEHGTKTKFDAAIIMIHGEPGENGKMQGYLDMLSVPYTTSGVLASAMTFDKSITKTVAKSLGITVSDEYIVDKNAAYNTQAIAAKTGLPCFVKPNNAGSSFGVTLVKDEKSLKNAIETAFKEDSRVMVEKLITGTEVTCGIIKTNKNTYSLPLTEIVSKNAFFDYQAKYEGKSEEITPARIPDAVSKQCQDYTNQLAQAFQLRGMARADFIIVDKKPVLLEINTIPGMSENSIIPQQVKCAGLSLTDIFTDLINDIV